MSDPYSIRDQRDPDGLLLKKRQSEYNLVALSCNDSYKIFPSSNKPEYTWEHGFFLKLLEDHPDINPRILAFWKKAPIFKKLNPPWEVKLSIRAYNFIASDPKLLNNTLQYLIDLMMGRFRLTSILSHYFFLTTPRYANEEKLFCVAVAEKYPEQTFKLIVGIIIDFDLKKSAKQASKEICGEEILLESFDKFIPTEAFIEYEEGYRPGDYDSALKSENYLKTQESNLLETKEEQEPLKEIKLSEDDKSSVSIEQKESKLIEEMVLELVISIVNKIVESSDFNILKEIKLSEGDKSSASIEQKESKSIEEIGLELIISIVNNIVEGSDKNTGNEVSSLLSNESMPQNSRGISENFTTNLKIEEVNKEAEINQLKEVLKKSDHKDDQASTMDIYDNPQNNNISSGKDNLGIDSEKSAHNSKKKKDKDDSIKDMKSDQASSKDHNCIIEHEKRHYIDKNLEFTPSEEFKIGMPEDIIKLKESIERNRAKYLSFIKYKTQSFENWKDIVIYYWTLSEYSARNFNIFSDFNIIWDISLSRAILEVFKKMRENEFLHYLNKIIKFAQGYVIEDLDMFNTLNEKNKEDFLIVPLILENTNLMPIFSVLGIFRNTITSEANFKLKLVNFYSNESLYSEIENFKKIQVYSKVSDFFTRPGIKSITLIEKNIKVFPIYHLTQIKKTSEIKWIIFLCNIHSFSEDCKFFLSTDSTKTEFKKEFLNLNENTQKTNILKIQTGLVYKSAYYLNLEKSMTFSYSYQRIKSQDIKDNKERFINDNEYQFLFDVDFNPYKNQEQRYGSYYLTQKMDIYDQLLIYLMYYIPTEPHDDKFDCLIQSFSYLSKEELKNGLIEKQRLIAKYVDTNFINLNDNVENLYKPLCILGLIDKFPSIDSKITLEIILKRIIETIMLNLEQYIQILKLKVNFNIAIIGLSKILALARINKLTIDIIFETIFDYNILSKVIIQYLKILKDNKIEIDAEEINIYLEYTKKFNIKRRNFALINIIGLIKNSNKKIELLIGPALENYPLLEKIKIFGDLLKSFKPAKYELLSYLEFLSEKRIFSHQVFAIEEFLLFIKKSLTVEKILDKSDFPILESIIKIIRNEPILEGFNLLEYFKEQVKTNGFSECFCLFRECPLYIPELLATWSDSNSKNDYYNIYDYSNEFNKRKNKKEKKRTNNHYPWGYSVFLENIDKQIQCLPEEIQKSASIHVLNHIPEIKLKTQITRAYKANSQALKEAYKEVFRERLLNVKQNYNETLRFLGDEKKKSENPKNYILNDLLLEAKYFFETSEDDLLHRILIDPSESDPVIDFLKKYNKNEKSSKLEVVFEFIQKLVRDISNKEMSMGLFEHILKHRPETRKVFNVYITCGIGNEKEFEVFFEKFKEIEIEIKEKINGLKGIKKIIFTFGTYFDEINEKVVCFKEFIKNFHNLKISEFKLPDPLLEFINLIKFPIKSILFKSFVFKKSIGKNQDHETCLIKAAEKLKKLLIELISEKSTLNLNFIKNSLFTINEPTSIEKEVKALIDFFPNLKKNDIFSEFIKIFNILREYKDLQLLIININESKKALELPKNICEKYFFKDNEIYSTQFLNSIINLKEVELASISKKQILSLNLFFSQISKSSELVVLAYSLGEDELNFWQESFDENLEDKNITLKLIQSFSIIWSFLDIIKNYSNDFKSYLEKIVELILTEKYSNIIDAICECNSKIKYLDEFNKSLNNQEQVKLNKIKMICQDSFLKIIKKGTFSVELVAARPDEGYTSASISFNDLIELRDRALLSKYIIDQRKEKSEVDRTKDFETYDQFVTFVDTLCRYIDVLNELGHSLYKDNLQDEIEFYLKDGNFDHLIYETLNYEKTLVNNWKVYFKEISKKSYYINFLSGEMIYSIDNFVFDQSEEKLIKLLRVLKYMNKQPPSHFKEKKNPPSEINTRLALINEFLTNLQDSNDITRFSLSNQIKTQKEGTILLAETKEFYRGILSIYVNYQETLPSADLVLFCHFSTAWSEIKRFINRCVLNPKQEIYTLVNPEKLPLENQIKIDSKLHRLTRKQKFYRLAIVTSDCKSKLVSSLTYSAIFEIDKIQNFMFVTDKQILSIMENLSHNIVVVTSAYAGLGKTKFIEDEAKRKNVPLYEINISATYDNSGLSERIENSLKPGPAMYRFNLNFLSDPEYFHELIFSLAVFKVVYNEKSIIVVPKDSYIYIEIANTYKNLLYNSVKFLKYLKTKNLKGFRIEKVAITENLVYVCNYLSLLMNKKIDSTDLSFVNDSKRSLFNDKNHYFELLIKYFLPNCGEFPNFHQLTTFVKVLTKLFENFEKNMFSSEIIKFYIQDFKEQNLNIFKELRSCIVMNLIETSKEFMSKCVDTVKNSQNSMLKSLEDEKQEELQFIDSAIKWENSNHFIMIFLEEDYMNIYRSPEKIPAFIKKFIISQNLIENIIKKKITKNLKQEWENCQNGIGYIEDYSSYTSKELIEKLLNFYKKFAFKRIPGSIEEKETFDIVSKRRLEEAINTGYILTPDNFLKMNLIYMRCISNLPLIIMGETGCGKTSLLRFLIENVLRESFLIIYIHSGITVSDIYKHLENANKEGKNKSDQKVWVFFDEFNTSDCMGEIVSVLCERRFEGIELEPNLVFVGACNPYRLKSKTNFKENVGIKRRDENNSKFQIMHVVKPLPDKAIEFVWDFGTLKHKEIKDYVYSMLNKVEIRRVKLFTDVICKAHEYFQNNEDCSSVSLRDVNRFILLYKWFAQSIQDRKKFAIKQPREEYTECYERIKEFNGFEEIFPELLSFFHCYYLRIASEEQRDQFIDLFVEEFAKNELKFNRDQIKILIRFQELDLVNRMILPREIALNQALIENIFAIVPCILNKIPIFICGKPGCSKSLAINIISSSLRGDRSTDEYFRTLPELQIVSFQGSDSCTSAGIEEVFFKAGKLLNQNKSILPVVLFDEIGLAEISRYNPLKVLHKLLEYENCKVGFIAISNWRLDASKMNRALYLARPDPNENDLIVTAETLFSSYRENNDFKTYLQIIKLIAEGYYKMKQSYEKTPFADFFGLRDFYHTIKYIAKNLKNSLNLDINTIIQTALLRNFDGLPTSIEMLSTFFRGTLKSELKEFNTVSLIQNNLEDPSSRYLMIICAQDASEYIKSELLSKNLARYRFILGSTFERDINQENTRFRNLSDIIGYMEQGVPIILQNMDIIYSSLYDLFNQNFTILSQTRKYCRVALGAQFNPRCLVHESFKAIVFLDSQESTLTSTDAPFLNRFEKHYIVLSDIIQRSSIEVSQEVCKWVEKIIQVPDKKNCLNVRSVFPIFSQETLNLYIVFLGETKNPKELKTKCKKFLLQNSSIDIILLCEINEMSNKQKEKIIKEWKRLHSLSLVEYFFKLIQKEKQISKEKRVRMISVTYDTAGIDFFKQKLGQIVQLEKCSNFKCEEEFKKNYGQFLSDTDKVLYVLELEHSKESHHLRFIINLMDSIDINFGVNENKLMKNICILIRQKRSDDQRNPVFLFKDWKYKMFEDLISDLKEITEELLQKNLGTIAQEENIFKFETYSGEIVEKSLETIFLNSPVYDYNFLNSYKKNINDLIINDALLISKFKEKIIKAMANNKIDSKEKWVFQVFTSEKVINSAISLKDAIKVLIYDTFLLEFTKIIVKCEKLSGLCSLSFAKTSEVLYEIWIERFEKVDTTIIQVNNKAENNSLKFLTNFRIPFFYEDYNLLKTEYAKIMKSGMGERESSLAFKEFHLEKLNFYKKSALFYTNIEFETNFVRDFIEISLTENLSDFKHSEYIYHFIYGLLSLTDKDSYIMALFDSQAKILLFNNLISLYKKYCLIDTNWILRSLGSDKPFIKNINSIFEKIIQDVSPLGEHFSNIEDMNAYCEDIKALNIILQDLIFESKPGNFDLLQIWVHLCEMNNKDLIIEIACEIIDKPHNFLFRTNKATWAIETISNVLLNSDVSTYRFKMFFFTKIIENNSEMIPFIVNQVNELGTWKYSAELIETILDRSELKEIISKFENTLLDFDKILNVKNLYLQKTFEIIESLDYNSPFCVILGSKLEALKIATSENLYSNICKVYMDYIESCNKDQQKLILLIAASRVQYYLNQFVELSCPDRVALTDSEQNIANSIGNVLKNRKTHAYELYCLKALRGYIGDTVKLHEYCITAPYKWNINYRDIRIQSNLHLFPIVEDVANSDSYLSILIKIDQLKVSLNKLDEEISKPKDMTKTFEFGLAFMNTVYLMYTKKEFDKSVFINWYEQKVNKINQNFGQIFSLLLKLFIYNFPQDSLCYLHENIESRNLSAAMLICYITLIGISYNKTPNRFSSQFFNVTGEAFDNISKHSEQIFYIGAESNKMQDYLKTIKENFEILKSTTFRKGYSVGGSYKCSDDCDYFYFINDCGGPQEVSQCPFCKKQIGGIAHKIVERPGHQNLTDEEAKNYLKNKCDYYQTIESKGFRLFNANSPQSKQRRLQQMVTFSILNFFTNSVFYILLIMNIYPVEQFNAVYHKTEAQDLIIIIETILKQNFREFESNLGVIDLVYWLLESANKFREVMNELPGCSEVKEARDEFEELFEQKIMNKNFLEMSNEYKRCLNTLTKPSILIKYIEELESPQEEVYYCSELFRYGIKSNWNLMKKSFMQLPYKDDLMILNYYIQNYDELQNLELLWPIVHFSREMINECSFQFSRAEAIKLEIGKFLVTREHLQQSFSDFVNAWNKLKIELRFDCKVFKKTEFSQDTPLAYFLVDTDINSQGIQLAAAIKTLSEMQNMICSLHPKNNKTVIKRYSYTTISKEDIFYINHETLESLVQKCSISSFEYGKGREIFYDFPQVLQYLEKYLGYSKMLNSETIEDIETIQYQFELLHAKSKYTGIFNEIRENIKPLPLSLDEIRTIERAIMLRSENFKADIVEVWNQAYTWLAKVILFVRHYKSKERKNIEIYSEIKISTEHNFKVQEIFYPFKVDQFIAIYELVEIKVFPKVVKFIDQQYKVKLPNRLTAKKSVIKFYDQIRLEMPELSAKVFIECHNVLKRIIIRLLTANTDPEFKITEYYEINQYWNYEFLDMYEKMAEMFPREYCLKHAIELENLFEDKAQEFLEEL